MIGWGNYFGGFAKNGERSEPYDGVFLVVLLKVANVVSRVMAHFDGFARSGERSEPHLMVPTRSVIAD